MSLALGLVRLDVHSDSVVVGRTRQQLQNSRKTVLDVCSLFSCNFIIIALPSSSISHTASSSSSRRSDATRHVITRKPS